jgi:hypothetical protein
MIKSIALRHLRLSFDMLKAIIDKCPDTLWFDANENKSVWKRLLHALESLDYWLDDFGGYAFKNLFPNFSAEMDSRNHSVLSKSDVSSYFVAMAEKIDTHFSKLTEEMLLDKSKTHPKVTHLDIILSQIRHVQVNIGYCNEMLSAHGVKNVEWIGYNEASGG